MADLVTLEEAKTHLEQTGEAKDALINSLIAKASARVKQEQRRSITDDGALIHFATIRRLSSELFLPSFPILTLTEVKESDFGTIVSDTNGTVLVAGTDYIAANAEGKLTRILSSLPTTWEVGYRIVRVKWTTGVAAADVSETIKKETLDYIAAMYEVITKQGHNLQTVNDGLGTVTRMGPPMLTSLQKKTLWSDKNVLVTQRYVTWEQ